MTDQPVKFVLNTHWHGDHTGGNENLAGQGTLVVAHDNVRERMSSEQVSEFFGRTTPPVCRWCIAGHDLRQYGHLLPG